MLVPPLFSGSPRKLFHLFRETYKYRSKGAISVLLFAEHKNNKKVKKMENGKAIMVPVLLLFAVSAVSAAGFEYDETPMLLAVHDNAKCRVDFTSDLIDSMVEESPEEENLTEYQDTLNEDLDELYDLAEEGDREGFKEYMRNTFEPNFRDAKQAMRESRDRIREGEEQGQGKMWRLRNEYLEHLEDYEGCHYESMKGIAEERVNWMNAVLEHWSERADDLADKGVDTSEMEDVIEDAEETIVDAFEDEVESATTGYGVRKALGGYCLGNGCPNGVNHHFYAKAEIAKLGGILDYLEEDAEEAGLGNMVGEAQGYLDSADGGVQDTGQNQYGQGVSETVWDNIRSAAETLRDIFSELRGA